MKPHPRGYAIHPDPKVQSLEIHLEHAKDIQRIYDLYEELGCLAQVKSQIDSLWPERNYSRGRIYKILTNPIYIGKIRHKTDIYEGLHSAIIDVAQFNRVQEQLKLKSAIKRGTHPYARIVRLLDRKNLRRDWRSPYALQHKTCGPYASILLLQSPDDQRR